MNNSINLYKYILTGIFYLVGATGLMLGEFLFSTALIGTATAMSNLHLR